MNFIVRIDHLSDEDLVFFGFVKTHTGPEFSTYLHVRYNEEQPVSNDPPRYLIVDDWNDAQLMGGPGGLIITGPQQPPKSK